MIEQYLYNLITGDSTLQGYLTNGGGGYHVYPGVVPKDLTFNSAVAINLIGSSDTYPNAVSKVVQFNIFAKTHTRANEIAVALSDLFNGDHLQTSGGVKLVFSKRESEVDLGYDYDVELFQRNVSYYFKLNTNDHG